MAMGIKLICLLVIIAVVLQTAQGGKILKKLTKELKKVLGGSKFEDYVKDNLVEVADNSDKIHNLAVDVAGAIVDIADNKVDVANNAVAISSIITDVSNSAAAISSNDAEISIISNDVAEATRCTAADWSYSCCTSANPCSFGKGDCNSNDECGGALICGANNCLNDFGFGDSGLDCCINDNAANIASNAAAISSNDADILSIATDVAAATRCNGILNYDISCCTSSNPCGINQGDCDYDSDCNGDLICGKDNCKDLWPGFGDAYADCCIDGLRHHVSEECTCQTMTISLSGAYQLTRAGDYQESAMVNGHPSWINADHAIWWSDYAADWAVGAIDDRGSSYAGIRADGQGTTCPYSISSSNWDYYNGGSWVSFSSSVMSVACSKAKVLNGEFHGANSTMAHMNPMK